MRARSGYVAVVLIVLLIVAVAAAIFGLGFGFGRGNGPGGDGTSQGVASTTSTPPKEIPPLEPKEPSEKKVKIEVSKVYGMPSGSQETDVSKVVQFLNSQSSGTVIVIGTSKATAGRGAEIREALRNAGIKFLEEE